MSRASDDLILSRFEPLFAPRSVAVAGASASLAKPGNRFIEALRKHGFKGEIYPIHPHAPEIDGLTAYRTVADVPEPVDYAFVAVGAQAVVKFLRAARNRLKFAQVMSSGFGETTHGIELEAELVRTAREVGIRVVGPNCIGLYSPRGKLPLLGGAMDAGGGIGVVSQSGGLSLDILGRGRVLGVKFRAIASIGNCADVGPSEFLDYMLADPETKVIGFYLEKLRDGRMFFEALRNSQGRKPVIILKGGQTQQGQRAAASHTGALANDNRLWAAVIRQTGAIPALDLNDLIHHFAAFQASSLVPEVGVGRAILFGNGGGTGVIATDQFGRCGIDIAPLNNRLVRRLDNLEMPDGASIANPIDVPANILMREKGEKARCIVAAIREEEPDAALVMHLNLPVIDGYKDLDTITGLIAWAIECQVARQNPSPFHLVLRSDGAPRTEKLKTTLRAQAIVAGIPVFDELKDSANVLSSLQRLADFRLTRGIKYRYEVDSAAPV